MSLLLDALKKAADDKNKKSDSTPGDNDSNLDLDLDLKSDSLSPDDIKPDTQGINNLNEVNDNFPEVNEDAAQENKESIPEKDVINTSNEDPDSSYPNDSDALEFLDNKQNEPDNNDHSEQPVELSIEDVPLDTNGEIQEPDIEEEIAEDFEVKPAITANKTSDENLQRSNDKIKNEQALSALINKSNQHSRREKLKKNISIAILTALILIGAGLYFYIQMKMTSQDLYLAQNNNADINRNNIIENNNPVAVQNTVKSVTPTKQAIKQKNTTTQTKPRVQTASISKSANKNKTAATPISIVRTKKSDPVHVLLQEAYSSFHKQEYQKSKQLYNKVLKRENRNRDALLGLAAIAIKDKQFEYARQKYQYLLKLNPRDSIALAGLSSIEDHINPQLNESQLKFMLKQQPDSAHLYFALGSQYSSQDRWAEAQSAYFSAWSAENKNSDYAYNLAVSLDHLDKKQQALNFYRLSIKLKQASSGNFSQINTEKRIRTLQESSK